MTIFSHKHTRGDTSTLHPVRDWFMLLGVATFLIIGSIVWNLWLFSQVTRGGTLGSAPQESSKDIGLESITNEFAERAYERSRYETPGRFADPSR